MQIAPVPYPARFADTFYEICDRLIYRDNSLYSTADGRSRSDRGESSLSEVSPGIIEAAVSMGASPIYIIVHFILPEATPSLLFGAAINISTVLGYSAMAGVIGGGGLGAIALQYGYYRYQKDVLWTTVTLLIIMVMTIQEGGNMIAKKARK